MKTLLTFTTVLTALAVAAPGALGAGKSNTSSSHSLQYERHQGTTFITDTLAPGGGQSSPYDAQQQGAFITDTLAPGGGVAVQSTPAATGFSWADAGVGAAAALGGILALLGITLLTTRRRAAIAI